MGNHGETDLKITMKSRNQTFEIVQKSCKQCKVMAGRERKFTFVCDFAFGGFILCKLPAYRVRLITIRDFWLLPGSLICGMHRANRVVGSPIELTIQVRAEGVQMCGILLFEWWVQLFDQLRWDRGQNRYEMNFWFAWVDILKAPGL